MKKELVIYQAFAQRYEQEVKGVTVSTILFDAIVISNEGDYVGEYYEAFTFSMDPIIYEKSDFLGKFIMSGESQFGAGPAMFNVEIKEENEDMFMLGVNLCDTLKLLFDDEAGELYFFPQQVGNIIHPQVGEMYALFLTSYPNGEYSEEDPLIMGYSYDGNIKITKSCATDGYLVYGMTPDQSASGWLDGYYDIMLTPAGAAAPARQAAVYSPMSIYPKSTKLAKRTNHHVPTTDHLQFNGKYNRRPLRDNIF
jgi:hypothetical protein